MKNNFIKFSSILLLAMATTSCLGCKFNGSFDGFRTYKTITYENFESVPQYSLKLSQLNNSDQWLAISEQKSFVPVSKIKVYAKEEMEELMAWGQLTPKTCYGPTDPIPMIGYTLGVTLETTGNETCFIFLSSDNELFTHFEEKYHDVSATGTDNILASPAE
jgi:hypothetical protein